ncbi:MAG: acyl carrier protein [Rhizobiales bacterium]|nr:acyl carrier protein [Hyphomicrobiales bacterium]
MTPIDRRPIILQILAEIAPDIELDQIRDEVNFRDQFDFDSLDFLRFVTALDRRFGATIGETDYPRLSSLKGCLNYYDEKTRDVA